jgi:hypothetical protein
LASGEGEIIKEGAKAGEAIVEKAAKDVLKEAEQVGAQDATTAVAKGAAKDAGSAAKIVEGDGGRRLLGADHAEIDPKKVTDYALNPDHPVGGNKARVFDSALGFNQGNADDLMNQIQRGVTENEPIPGAVDKYGQRFTVDIPVTGPKGSGVVRTGWIYGPESTTPRMTTLFVK